MKRNVKRNCEKGFFFKGAIDAISPQLVWVEQIHFSVSTGCLLTPWLTNQHLSVCVLPESSHIVAGGPAQHKAPLRAAAPLTHLFHVGCGPHLAHTHLGLLLKVVG